MATAVKKIRPRRREPISSISTCIMEMPVEHLSGNLDIKINPWLIGENFEYLNKDEWRCEWWRTL